MKDYTIKELAELLEVSERTILRQIQTISDKLKNPYSKDFKIQEELKEFIFSDKIQTFSDNENDEFTHIEHFTEEEYLEFQKRLTEYPLIKEQLEYVKELMEKNRQDYQTQLALMKTIINSIEQRNFIEAKEKGLDQ